MRNQAGPFLLLITCFFPAPGAADSAVNLDALRWRHRILLLPAEPKGSTDVDWMGESDALLDRQLILFRQRGGGYDQWFPKTRTTTRLKLSNEMRELAAGRVTLIGKDGQVKRQWSRESHELPAAVFGLIDSMPMRQREMRRGSKLGRELIGTKAREWTVGPEWGNSKPIDLGDLRGQVVMVRFWTDGCPYCAASLPAMQRLAEEFQDQPVTFVGLYQSKPFGSERPWAKAMDRARELGVAFPIAYDHDWRTLRSWWLEGERRAATSASFIIAADGTIVHVHPGPVFFPSDAPENARPNADYEAIRAEIRAQLRRR